MTQKTILIEELRRGGSRDFANRKEQLPVAPFGEIEFTNGKIGTDDLGTVEPRTGVNMEDSKGVLQIRTGRLNGPKDNMFDTNWKHS